MPRFSKPIELPRAQAFVAEAARTPLPSEEVPLERAQGRVLAEPVCTQADVPPFASSAMDGFAVIAGDAGRTLRIMGESRAGAPAEVPVVDGDAIRISTGAAIPSGADAVIPLELCSEDGQGRVFLAEAVTAGRNVRGAGEDMRAGTRALEQGERLGAVELAVAIGAGLGSVRCARRPRVAVLTTGDELRPPGGTLMPGQIHNSNSLMLASLSREAGAELLPPTHAGDDARQTQGCIAGLLAAADLLLIAGGVSVGPHDHVKGALEGLGCKEIFWGVSIRPGKPTWFGSHEGALIFGLPGNPVSAMVIFMLLVRPALAALQGARRTTPDPVTVPLAATVARDAHRTQAVRVRLAADPDGRLCAWPTGDQGSHVTTSMLGADALALIEPGAVPAEAGMTVQAVPIR